MTHVDNESILQQLLKAETGRSASYGNLEDATCIFPGSSNLVLKLHFAAEMLLTTYRREWARPYHAYSGLGKTFGGVTNMILSESLQLCLYPS